ncbi:hypothetical protein RND81_07G169300 [Saponaria officinalis]|uniref:non-specific serine/threonine protein kinase n=1 Tax=Saponaria officinalis TaxID=3572 RepID=A0AAW1JRU2_SAPOF
MPVGMLKQLHTRLLYILTRCTRLSVLDKSIVVAEDVVDISSSGHFVSFVETTIHEPLLVPCRVCEQDINSFRVKGHSVICTIASSCDQKGMTVNERFSKIAETLEFMIETPAPTPTSLILTSTKPVDLVLSHNVHLSEPLDRQQIVELADIARRLQCVESVDHCHNCLEELEEVIENRVYDDLTVDTFGASIKKLIREKRRQLEQLSNSKIHPPNTTIDGDRISIDDFNVIKPISRGAFGRVFLARKLTTGDIFAIKVLRKKNVIRKNAIHSIQTERDILTIVDNPFVVRLFYSFTSRENLYLVMEYLNEGDLYSLLRNLGCLDEDSARTYIAEVVLALDYLHSLNVVHRDLKPDNLLIAHDGHIKLTDFGLSKVGIIDRFATRHDYCPNLPTTSSFEKDKPQPFALENQQERSKKRRVVGTPDYMAPEILLGKEHGATADWWSLGVILFELIVGVPPFNAERPKMIFDNILGRNISWPKIPEQMSYEAWDLIDKLLTIDPNQRLGAGGAAEVKGHPFFDGINWDTLYTQEVQSDHKVVANNYS